MKKIVLLALLVATTALIFAGSANARRADDRDVMVDHRSPADRTSAEVPMAADDPVPVVDMDSDGVIDTADNCVSVANADQRDTDGDDIGDVCDDSDGDTIMDDIDNCPMMANTDQQDTDEDGMGDACVDTDGDGFKDAVDNCPLMYNSRQNDQDHDGFGDYCDNCRLVPNPTQEDSDGDSIGDMCETDWDADGVLDDQDNCWLKKNPEQTDTDEDGLGDICDPRCDGPACPVSGEVIPAESPPAANYDGGCNMISQGGSGSMLTGIVLMIMAAVSIAGIRKKI